MADDEENFFGDAFKFLDVPVQKERNEISQPTEREHFEIKPYVKYVL